MESTVVLWPINSGLEADATPAPRWRSQSFARGIEGSGELKSSKSSHLCHLRQEPGSRLSLYVA